MNKHFERIVINQLPPLASDIFSALESASAHPDAGVHADGPHGHHHNNKHSSSSLDQGCVINPTPTPTCVDHAFFQWIRSYGGVWGQFWGQFGG